MPSNVWDEISTVAPLKFRDGLVFSSQTQTQTQTKFIQRKRIQVPYQVYMSFLKKTHK